MVEERKIEVQDEDTEVEANESRNSEPVQDAAIPEQFASDEAPENSKEEETEKLKERLEELEAENKRFSEEAKANYDKFVRVSADFDNYKKRSGKELSDLKKFANEKLLRELLSVVDNLERAIESGVRDDSNQSTILEGVEITLKDVLRTLEKHGVKSFDSKGEDFDPVYHQAMMQELTDEHPDNTVVNELQKGYTIHDRLLRPAMVVVSKAAPEKGADENNSADDT